MPELPDLQVFSRNLEKELAGKKVEEIHIRNTSKLKEPATKFKKSLEGTTIKKIYREGKELHFQFSNGEVLGVHLMLHGKLNFFEGKNDQKNTIIEILFTDGTGLAMSDYQGMATPTLNPQVKPSPDALSNVVDYKFLKEQLAKKR